MAPVEIKRSSGSLPYVGISKAFDLVGRPRMKCWPNMEPMPRRADRRPRRKPNTTGLARRFSWYHEAERSRQDQLAWSEVFVGELLRRLPSSRNGMDEQATEHTFNPYCLGRRRAPNQRAYSGNLNVGNDRKVLLVLITQLLPWVGYPRTLNAIKCLNEVNAIRSARDASRVTQRRPVVAKRHASKTSDEPTLPLWEWREVKTFGPPGCHSVAGGSFSGESSGSPP